MEQTAEELAASDAEWAELVEHGPTPNRKHRRDFVRLAPRRARLAYGFGLWRSHLISLDPGWPEAR